MNKKDTTIIMYQIHYCDYHYLPFVYCTQCFRIFMDILIYIFWEGKLSHSEGLVA